jgi:septation ring formation regulator EzrA
LKLGELLGNILYFSLVLLIVIIILKYAMGGLIEKIVKKRIEINNEIKIHSKRTADTLEDIKKWNVPLS